MEPSRLLRWMKHRARWVQGRCERPERRGSGRLPHLRSRSFAGLWPPPGSSAKGGRFAFDRTGIKRGVRPTGEGSPGSFPRPPHASFSS